MGLLGWLFGKRTEATAGGRAPSRLCAYCGKEISGEFVEEPHFDNPTSTGPWFYHPVCWDQYNEHRSRLGSV